MKKHFFRIILVVMSLVVAFSMIGCGTNANTNNQTQTEQEQIYEKYVAYAKAQDNVPLSYEQWLDSIRGEDGTDGQDGQDGKDAYEIAVEKGYSGTYSQWVDIITGAAAGEGKSAYQLAVENGYSGTLDQWLQTLVGAKGNDGTNGKSAYQIWLDAGNSGTPDQFLASLQGAKGNDGTNGKSAYQIWLDAGNTGNEQVFINSLKGEKGDPGTNGKDAYDVAKENGFTGTYQDWVNMITGGSVSSSDFVLVTAYAQPNTGADVADEIQQCIDENPNKTIYFPDGEYLISKPILTSAHAEKSVSLKLADFAVIKADKNSTAWNTYTPGTAYQQSNDDTTIKDCMIRLGAKDSTFNSLQLPAGSVYSLTGGIIDGNGVANGVSVDGGRETRISDLSMKNIGMVGLHVKYGVNGGSSDIDVTNVHIVADGLDGSIGVVCRGHDNSFSNMRINGFQTGFKISGGGNFIEHVHPLYYSSIDSETGVNNGKNDDKYLSEADYISTVAFHETQIGNNFYDNAYSDQYRTGFIIADGSMSSYDTCFAMWWSDWGPQSGFYAAGNFHGIIDSARVDFSHSVVDECTFFSAGSSGCLGVVINPIYNHYMTWNGNSVGYGMTLQGKVINTY